MRLITPVKFTRPQGQNLGVGSQQNLTSTTPAVRRSQIAVIPPDILCCTWLQRKWFTFWIPNDSPVSQVTDTGGADFSAMVVSSTWNLNPSDCYPTTDLQASWRSIVWSDMLVPSEVFLGGQNILLLKKRFFGELPPNCSLHLSPSLKIAWMVNMFWRRHLHSESIMSLLLRYSSGWFPFELQKWTLDFGDILKKQPKS